jgi:hypothetical protein
VFYVVDADGRPLDPTTATILRDNVAAALT